MSGLAGWIGAPGGGGDRSLAERMARALAAGPDGRVAAWVSGAAGLAAERPGAPPHFLEEGGVACAVDGRPWFADEDLAALARARGPAAAVLEGWRRHGADLFKRVHGGFSAAVLEPGRGEAVLVTDRAGSCPLWVAEEGGTLVFASSPGSIGLHPAARDGIDPQGVFHYVYFAIVPGPGSVWEGCSRLLPAELAHWRGGRLERRTYWQPTYVCRGEARLDDLAGEMRRILRDTVRRSVEDAGTVGCFLSGGLDSSTVAGVLKEVAGAARTYTIGFDAEGYDEMEYARIAARHFGTDHHEYYVTPSDVEALVPELARVYAEPFGNESAVPVYHCAKLAREDGVSLLLAGDGGDEIFAGNERYATQGIFEMYGRLPAFLRRGLLEPLLDHFPFGDRLWPVRKGRSYVRQANIPLPMRMQTWNVVERDGFDAIFEPSFLARVDRDGPRKLLEAAYHGARAESALHRMLALDWKFTLADSDLPKVGRMCDLAGVEVTYPFLDTPMVEMAARVPVRLKLKRGRLRHFYKEAMRGFLPDATLAKSKHGFGLPFGVWMRTHAPLQDLARDSLEGLRGRGVLKESFVDRVVEAHRSEHAAYYGAMIWCLMMLEQWYRAHADARVPAGS